MTEQKWLSSTDPSGMLEFLGPQASDRKLRLFACACCRLVWDLFTDDRSRRGVEVAERFADGNAQPRERAVARNQSLAPVGRAELHVNWAAYWTTTPRMGDCVGSVCEGTAEAAARAGAALAQQAGLDQAAAWDEAHQAAVTRQASLLRDIFGNPFQPVSLESAWSTLTVRQLAQAIYQEKNFDHLPILADALEEAGCTNSVILDHCRQEGEHVRGCWVVDLVLDKPRQPFSSYRAGSIVQPRAGEPSEN